MNFFKKFIFIFLFIILQNNAHSDEKIAFLNLDFLVNNSILGKSILNNLKKISTNNIKNLKLKEKSLIDNENEIKKTKNILSKEELDSKILKLNEEIKKYNTYKEKSLNEFEKKRNEELKIFFEKINPLITSYMIKNSISLLLDKKYIYIGLSNHDITQDILNIIDNNFK
jgi:outer membrane protein